MPNLTDLLNASQFEGLAITKTPAGFAVSVMSGLGEWSEHVTAGTAADAVEAALFVPPPCPVPLP